MGGMKSRRGQACRRACPPPSLYLAGPFSAGYVEFFTFLMPPCGLSLRLDVSKIDAPVGARSILALLLSNKTRRKRPLGKSRSIAIASLRKH